MPTRKIFFSLLLISMIFSGTLSARESEGERENSLLLNGVWEYAIGEGNEQGESTAGQQTLDWKQITLPQRGLPFKDANNETKIVWARRTFSLTPQQAKSLAVLRWNRIANGAEAFLNGRKVGENEPTGPYQVIVPTDVFKAGENQIVLKIRGAAGVRRSKSGNPMFPCGFGVGVPQVTDDLWIDFANDAYMKWVLAMPDLATGRVIIRVTPVGLKKLDNLSIVTDVRLCNRSLLTSTMGIGGNTKARLIPDPDPLGGEHFYVEVQFPDTFPDFHQWDIEQQPLYEAMVALVDDESVSCNAIQ